MASKKSTKKTVHSRSVVLSLSLSLPHAVPIAGHFLLNHSISASVSVSISLFRICSVTYIYIYIHMCSLMSGSISIWQNACWIFVTYSLTLEICRLHIKWTVVIWACTIAPISHTLFICNSMFWMCKHICGCCYATTTSSSSS